MPLTPEAMADLLKHGTAEQLGISLEEAYDLERKAEAFRQKMTKAACRESQR